jgi:hypothetical protein
MRAVGVGVGHVGALPEVSGRAGQYADNVIAWDFIGLDIFCFFCESGFAELLIADKHGSYRLW